MARKKHLREQKPDYKRSINQYSPRLRILIVCEGEKTEVNYFRGFPIKPEMVVDVQGIGSNTIRLVREAIRLKEHNNYDHVWCVFDKDEFPIENFNLALQVARENGIMVAYSNEAFELWYVLHFEYLNSGITRQQYINKLNRLLGKQYEKNDTEIYQLIFPNQKEAIHNANRLLKEYPTPNPACDNPSTTVHLLVQQLNRFFWEV